MTHQLFIEIFATACGLLGSLVLSLKGERAAWGWVLFAMSNVGWLVFSFDHSHWFMFIQQIGFSITSAIGIWRWLIEPAIDRRYQHIVRGNRAMNRELILGALEPPIATQLAGMNFKPDQLERWQRFANSITLLNLHGFMSDTAAMQARKRLVTMVQKGLT